MTEKTREQASDEQTSDEQYCFYLVKNHDQDSYLSSLLAPAEKRRYLFAIYAFQVEIENCISQVSEAPIGEIRLQWWIDTLDILFSGRGANHPVARELSFAISECDLPKHLFANLIYERRNDLYPQPIKTNQELFDYCTATKGAIIELSLRTLIGYEALELETEIKFCGLALGVCSILNTFPVHLSRKRCMVPLEALHEANLTEQSVFLKQPPKELMLELVKLRHLATQQITQARIEQTKVSKQALPAFYPSSLVDLYVKQLADENHSPFTMIAECSQLSKQWHLLKKSWLEKF